MPFSHSVLILGTFSGSAVINYFLNVKILEIIYLKISKFKEITKEGKFLNLVET